MTLASRPAPTTATLVARQGGGMKPSIERLRELVMYDPDTGVFTSSTLHKTPGVHLFNTVDFHGYLRGRLTYTMLMASDVAFAWMEGAWPVGTVDHINRNRQDNRWANLRLATPTQNRWNRHFRRGRSGLLGVTRSRSGRHFRAIISNMYVRENLGSFGCPTTAAIAYDRRCLELRGEFAVTNFLKKGGVSK